MTFEEELLEAMCKPMTAEEIAGAEDQLRRGWLCEYVVSQAATAGQ